MVYSVLTDKNVRNDIEQPFKAYEWLFCHTIPASGSLSHTALAVAAESAFSSSEGPRASVQLLATAITGSHKQSFVPK